MDTNKIKSLMFLVKGAYTFAIVVGIIILLISLGFAVVRLVFVLHATKTQGTVVDLVWGQSNGVRLSNSSRGTVLVHPVVSYTTLDGQTLKYTSNTTLYSTNIDIGDKIDILYATNNPSKALIYSFKDMWLLPLIGTLSSLILIVIGCAFIYSSKIYLSK